MRQIYVFFASVTVRGKFRKVLLAHHQLVRLTVALTALRLVVHWKIHLHNLISPVFIVLFISDLSKHGPSAGQVEMHLVLFPSQLLQRVLDVGDAWQGTFTHAHAKFVVLQSLAAGSLVGRASTLPGGYTLGPLHSHQLLERQLNDSFVVHAGPLYLKQRMLMVTLLLTLSTQVKTTASQTSIPCAKDSLTLALRAANLMQAFLTRCGSFLATVLIQ